jgi:hypothetical protein
VYWWRRDGRSAAAAARLLEHANASCRNVVITAEELLRHSERASPWIRERVLHDAARSAEGASARAAVPLTRAAVALAAMLTIVLAVQTLRPARGQGVSSDAPTSIDAGPEPLRIVATVTPPAYTGRPRVERADPARLEAIQGSIVHLTLSHHPENWRVRYGTQSLRLAESTAGSTTQTVVGESGYFAIEPTTGAQADRRLIPVAVSPDRAPVIRLETPGRDLLLPDARSTVDVGITAADDLGLQSLELRYTKVSGSGEQFEFQEGTVPIA